jgi:hypothetical protein
VRPFFLAWLTIALLLFALGRLSRAGDESMQVHPGQHVRVTVETAGLEITGATRRTR